MRAAEQIACLFWILISVGVCVGAIGLKLGTPSAPGPGFLPFGTGALMGILSVAHLLKVTFAPADTGANRFLGTELNWRRSLAAVLSILFYALLLPHLGYLLTTFLLMVVLFSLYERRNWWRIGLASILVIGVTYLVFHIWLKVQFPSGIF
jgi:putative tricarboxylic transport membrane protein